MKLADVDVAELCISTIIVLLAIKLATFIKIFLPFYIHSEWKMPIKSIFLIEFSLQVDIFTAIMHTLEAE